MSLTPAEQNHILEAESAWVDQSFGQLDLSQFPSLQPPPPEGKHDDRFAKSWADSGLSRSASDLRSFIENPETESLDRVGRETGIEEYAAEVRDRRSELVAQAFKRKCPNYIPTQENSEKMVETLAYNGLPVSEQDGDTEELIDRLAKVGAWTVENLQAAYIALSREGLLQVPAGQARQLSSSERLDVARMAQNGKLFEAIDAFLRYSLPDEEPTTDILTDPAYRDLLDTAVMHVWELSAEDYVPSVERRQFIQTFAAGRPLTLTLVTSAWTACKESEKKYERSALLTSIQEPHEPERPPKLDALSDEAVDDLYHRSLRAYAASIRAPGVLAQ
jgi:hypothetical protein